MRQALLLLLLLQHTHGNALSQGAGRIETQRSTGPCLQHELCGRAGREAGAGSAHVARQACVRACVHRAAACGRACERARPPPRTGDDAVEGGALEVQRLAGLAHALLACGRGGRRGAVGGPASRQVRACRGGAACCAACAPVHSARKFSAVLGVSLANSCGRQRGSCGGLIFGGGTTALCSTAPPSAPSPRTPRGPGAPCGAAAVSTARQAQVQSVPWRGLPAAPSPPLPCLSPCCSASPVRYVRRATCAAPWRGSSRLHPRRPAPPQTRRPTHPSAAMSKNTLGLAIAAAAAAPVV